MILGCMEVVAEGQTLSEKAGIGADEVQKLVQGIPIFLIFTINLTDNKLFSQIFFPPRREQKMSYHRLTTDRD